MKILLQAAKNRQRECANKGNHTMLVVFIDMGLRLSELINSQLDDLDMKRRSLKVRGKGAKDRKVFFGKRTFRALKKWLRVRDNVERVWDDTVFISRNGEKLKKRNIQRLISRIQKSAGLEDVKISPHVLRHTAATLAVQNGLVTFSLEQ
ncbi:tyrosine-type recombinase/integrase [Candidatus Bipolaricaulota bacterium]|nr:tyrosine-type recombinase/integrase [Candidatus Bipolaricaulota bacterium]